MLLLRQLLLFLRHARTRGRVHHWCFLDRGNGGCLENRGFLLAFSQPTEDSERNRLTKVWHPPKNPKQPCHVLWVLEKLDDEENCSLGNDCLSNKHPFRTGRFWFPPARKKKRGFKRTNQKKFPTKTDLNQRNRNLNQPTNPTAEIRLEGLRGFGWNHGLRFGVPTFLSLLGFFFRGLSLQCLAFFGSESRDLSKESRILWEGKGCQMGIPTRELTCPT